MVFSGIERPTTGDPIWIPVMGAPVQPGDSNGRTEGHPSYTLKEFHMACDMPMKKGNKKKMSVPVITVVPMKGGKKK
jgi:hypothetical protein